MSSVLWSLKHTFHFLKKDKIVLFLSLFPPLLGGIIYLLVGWFFFDQFRDWGEAWILQRVPHEFMSGFLQTLLSIFIILILLFIFNWTYVLVLSVLSSPFNDALSERIEALLVGKRGNDLSQTFRKMLFQAIKNIFNESKKIIFISFFTLLSLLLGFFPLFTPVAIFLSAILCSIQFLDYNWSRHSLSLSECLNDFKGNFLQYSLSGLFFLFAITIPLINIFILPLGVIFYSCLWGKSRHPILKLGAKENHL